MTMCNVKVNVQSDKLIENYQTTLQVPSALQSLFFFSLLFWFIQAAILIFWFSPLSSSTSIPVVAGGCSQQQTMVGVRVRISTNIAPCLLGV